MAHVFTPLAVVVLLFISTYNVNSAFAAESSKRINPALLVGAPCSLGGRRGYAGECRHTAECPSVVSNLHAGLHPSICLKVGRVAVVCCPTQRSVSDLKCEEYANSVGRGEDEDRIAPLLPLSKRKGRRGGSDAVEDVAFIVGGEEAAPAQFPHMVALGYGAASEGAWLCGGTLISDQFVLTAAHCLQNTRSGKLSRVLLGDVSLSTDKHSPTARAEVQIASTVLHPNYTSGVKYSDIALIKLAQRVRLSKAVRPACLPQGKFALERFRSPQKVIAAGWGLTEFLGDQSNILKFVGLTRWSHEECVGAFKGDAGKELQLPRGILRSQLCAGERAGEKDTCEGDSGGGLFVKTQVGRHEMPFVVGITSFGSKYCGFGEPGVYTNVQSFVDWIEDIVWPSTTS